jgi:hypothetical protein
MSKKIRSAGMVAAMFLNVIRITGACLIIFTFSLVFGTKVLSAEPTILHLDFQDGQGQKVEVTKATLALVAGNYVDKLPLKISKNGLDIPLDASWLRANWPGGKSRLKNLDKAYMFLKAPSYASICSNAIHWMGTETNAVEKNVVIEFPRSKTTVVSKGQKVSVTLNFRKPIERFLKLSGGKGKALAGVRVKSYVYWSKTDDGDLNGADLLAEGTTDETGRIPVIDGDFIYAFQVIRKATLGHKAETVLIVNRFEDKEYPVTVPDDPAVVESK